MPGRRHIRPQPRRGSALIEARVWKQFTDPSTLGAILMVAGALLIAAPWGELGASPSKAWWSTALASPEPARASAVLIAFAACLGLGALLSHLMATRRARFKRSWIGVMLMIVGVLGGLSAWFQGMRSVAVSRVALPLNQKIESFPAISVDRAYKVMLPNRIRVKSIDLENASAVINVSSAADVEGEDRSLRAGQALKTGRFTWSLIGVEHDPRIPRVVLASSKPNSIEGAGIKGQKVRFEVDGPEFEIVRISRNYLGAVGQAVELRNEEFGTFWVFGDENATETTPEGIRLERMESGPVAVLAVASDEVGQWFGASGVLFVFGLVFSLALAPLSTGSRAGDGDEEE